VLIAAVVAAGSSSVLAQSDPKLTSDVRSELDPDSVTLSRDAFTGRAAWRVKLNNGAANELNRAVFTARTVVVDANGSPVASAAAIDAAVGGGGGAVIKVTGADPGCVVGADPTQLTCSFAATGGTLPSGAGTEFIIVAKTPVSGDRLKLVWSFGGDEGNGNGNGCCTKTAETTYTTLRDAAALNATVRTRVQSFMVKGVSNVAFTGLTDGLPNAADPWKTSADLGTGYTVSNAATTYTQILIDEQDTSATVGSCSAIQSNKCWVSQITIPLTKWTAADPLKIRLDRHSSIIKNGSKLSNYFIQYKADAPGSNYVTLQQCTAAGPSSGVPCLDGACVEIPLPTSPRTFVWNCNVKALDNGGYKVQ
jgi:hypothetical protein